MGLEASLEEVEVEENHVLVIFHSRQGWGQEEASQSWRLNRCILFQTQGEIQIVSVLLLSRLMNREFLYMQLRRYEAVMIRESLPDG